MAIRLVNRGLEIFKSTHQEVGIIISVVQGKEWTHKEVGIFFYFSEQEELHMKLSSQENFSRMRPKLVVNHNFDQHMEASRLRDNDGK